MHEGSYQPDHRSLVRGGPRRTDQGVEAMSDEQEARCRKPVGTKPWWMGVDQYDQCRCLLPPGHDGECACEHGGA